jgi:DNA-binding beta-propeller fold protein YncE
MQGGALSVFADSAQGLSRPSGVTVHGENIYVSDNATSTIFKFDLEGNKLDAVKLARGTRARSLMGLRVGPDGAVYVTDFANNEVLKFNF